jgi:spore maturation protein B
MNLLLYLSDMLLPLVIFYIVGNGILHHRPVYDDFVQGAKTGFQTVLGVLPTLIGLMAAVAILRASGFLDWLGSLLASLLSCFLPAEYVLPDFLSLMLVKLFSSSAATGLALDIMQEYGTDSRMGFAAALALCSTETIFYTMSVYFMSVNIKKTRYTLPGALFATLVGIGMSLFLAFHLVS